jgi:hypothetical protein
VSTGTSAANLTQQNRELDSETVQTRADSVSGYGDFLDDLRLQVGEPITMTEEKPLYLLTGENVRVGSSQRGISLSSFVGGDPTVINQSPTSPTYAFSKTNYDTLNATDPNWDSNLDGSVALLQATFKNLTSYNGETTSQDVKTFMHTSTDATNDPGLAAPAADSTQASFEMTSYFIETPYDSYSDAEVVRLNLKFGWDRLYSAKPDEYVDQLINSKINTLSNDLRSGVLSRFDVVKTTQQLPPPNQFLEKITANETSEAGLSISAREFASQRTIAPNTRVTSFDSEAVERLSSGTPIGASATGDGSGTGGGGSY